MKRIFGIAVAALLALAGPAAAQGVIGVGTMSQGTLSYTTGSVIAQMMNERLALQARVQPNSGESTLLPLLNSGELDFAIANALEAAEAYEGLGMFAGRRLENLRVAAVLYPLRVALFARAADGISTVAELRERRVTSGFSAMGSVDTLLKAALAAGGVTLDDVRPAPTPSVAAGADQFVDGRADAFFFAVGAAKVSEVDATTPVRILAIEDSPEALARVRDIFPEGYIATAPAAPGMTGVAQPTPVLAFDNLLLTRADAPAETVRAVVEGLAAHREALIAGFPLFRGLDPDALVKQGLRVPFHDALGAR
ncbi:MAG: TAXI family TRAP transporter solute-binding subunit [Rubrimonas sp.]|uniref:TAXI family TRAP transporter solute-binding subunit n=1 Tax=Rubrimonas sp. TaxID=2036015 RepID=UPI002FDE3B1D